MEHEGSAPQILVIDLTSQYTLVIARRLRELGFRSAVLSPKRARAWLKRHAASGIILSGGKDSVYDKGAPKPPKEILNLGVPILGICYGMQWLAHELGGRVESVAGSREYGSTLIDIRRASHVLRDLVGEHRVWSSHGDSVVAVPRGFRIDAVSEDETIVAISNDRRKIAGLQFHPEVVDTPCGEEILHNFLTACKAVPDWKPEMMVERMQREVVEAVSPTDRVVLAYSGGVDSSTTAAALSPILRKNLLGVVIDHGGLREGELEEIRANAKSCGLRIIVVRATREFLKEIGNTTDAKKKRKAIQRVYRRILIREAKKFGASFIVQGTLATDLIESGVHGEAEIKGHHNTGIKWPVWLEELHPLRHLFKYEVRALARELGLPERLCERHPFPGPGNYIRINGKPPAARRLSLVRKAYAAVSNVLIKHGLYHDPEFISQLVVSLNCVNTVLVMGDGRKYLPSVVIRGLQSLDFMTGRGVRLPKHVKEEIEAAIWRIPGLGAVYYNEGNKPPVTTEPE